MYYYTLPDEFVRTQMAVGALVLFGVLRVICAAVGAQHSWRMSTVTRCFIGAAVLFLVSPAGAYVTGATLLMDGGSSLMGGASFFDMMGA